MVSDERTVADSMQAEETTASDNQQGSGQQLADKPSVESSDMSEQPVPLSDSSGDEPSLTVEAADQVDEHQDDSSQLQQLESEVADLKAQLEERTNLYIRLQADFDNFRKRTQREKEELELQVKCSTIAELLPVVDNFDRARSQLKPQTEEAANIHKSYQGVYKQLVDCLKRIGVSPMRSEGQEFDPGLHEAVIREPTDQYPEGTVIEELVRGYVLGEKVLRHAMVKVATAPESDGGSSDSEE